MKSGEFSFGDIPTSLPMSCSGSDGHKSHTSFNIPASSPMSPFMNDVARTLVQQPDYGGMGGHGVADHGGHGSHSQIDVNIGGHVVDIRTLIK